VFGADFTFDAANLSQSFEGFGAQIWPGDSRIEGLTNNLNLKYYRIAPGGCTSPPNDVTTAVMDAYVNSQYNGTTRGNSVEYSLGLAQTFGVNVIFIKFGGVPSTWLSDSTYKELKSEYFNDFARVWASEVLYFKNLGYKIDYTELFNEPEGNWNIKVSPANYNTVVKIVRAEFDSRGLTDVGIIGPGLAYLYNGTSWIGGLDTQGKNAIAAWSTHAWDEGWGNTSALPSFLDQRWQDYFGAAVESADPTHSKPIIVTEYATAVRTYNGITYDDSTYCDSCQFAERSVENSLTMANNGANVLCYWEAANQSWQDNFYGFQRVNSSYRPVYYAFSTIAPYIPENAKVMTKTWNDSEISAAGFLGSGKLVLAFANSTANTETRTIKVTGVANFSVTAIKAFDNNSVIDKTADFTYDFAAGSMTIELPAESTLTIAADVSECSASEIGDMDGDCKVTFSDFAKLASDWMTNTQSIQEEIIDDFESYTNDTILQSKWFNNTANVITTLNTISTYVHSGTKSLKYVYNNWNSPWWSKSERRLDGIVWGSTGEDWTSYTTVSFWYYATSFTGTLKFQIVDTYGTSITTYAVPSVVLNTWINIKIDITGIADSSLVKVGRVDVLVTPSTYGTGTFYIDDISISNSNGIVCENAPNGDVTGDCSVDIKDLKIMSDNWLECTLLDQSQCW
jgi:hypothetical protein